MSVLLFRRRARTASAPPAESIGIALSASAVTVPRSGTITTTVTLTRVGGYTGTVTPSVTGLPTGVTGSWSDSSLTGADATTILTLSAASDAGLVTADAYTITLSGSGVSDATAAATVTVTVTAGTPFFSDDFETGGFGGAGIASDTPGSVNYYTAGNSSSNTVEGGSLMSGTYCHRTRYIADTGGYDPERRMNLDRNITNFALQFDWLVPSNFAMRGTGSTQTKMFMFWQSTYGSQQPGWQFGGEFWRTSDSEAYFRPLGSVPTFGPGSGEFVYGLPDTGNVTFPLTNGSRFISPTGPVTPGTVAQIRIAAKPSSTPTGTDGTYRMWIDGVLFFTYTGNFHEKNWPTETGTAYVRYCNLLGESNPGYLAQTDFHSDNYLWYDSFPAWAA